MKYSQRYRKKPIIVEAIKWTGKNTSVVLQFCNKAMKIFDERKLDHLFIETLDGGHQASKGDWIIKGVQGEFYPVKNDIFLETYEKV